MSKHTTFHVRPGSAQQTEWTNVKPVASQRVVYFTHRSCNTKTWQDLNSTNKHLPVRSFDLKFKTNLPHVCQWWELRKSNNIINISYQPSHETVFYCFCWPQEIPMLFRTYSANGSDTSLQQEVEWHGQQSQCQAANPVSNRRICWIHSKWGEPIN